MKNLAFVIFIALFAISWLSPRAFAQTNSQNLCDEHNQSEDTINCVKLNFLLDPLSPLSEIGFDNPRSMWKVEYQLYLTQISELKKMGRCHYDDLNRFICPLIIKKKERKKFKKKIIKAKSVLIYKGAFKRNNLNEESNRNFALFVPLAPEIIKIINESQDSETNPVFVLFTKIKFNLKNSQKKRFKETREGDREFPLRAYLEGKKYNTFYLNKKEITVGHGISISPGGRIFSIPYGS